MDVRYFESVLHAKICAKFRWVIKLSKCSACDAAHFESVMVYPGKLNFIHAKSLGSPVKYDTFKVFCMPMLKLGQMQVL